MWGNFQRRKCGKPCFLISRMVGMAGQLRCEHGESSMMHTSCTCQEGRPYAFMANRGSAEPYKRLVGCGEGSEQCEEGLPGDAVEALNLLSRQGSYIPASLFREVLKGCTTKKELDVGRKIHGLVVSNGYELNRFLANHTICMYASHGRLTEALKVFAKLVSPDAYMWSSLILAHAEHGEPMQAIKLYWQMRQSRMTPDAHIFVAVLKACANATDLASGREVHADFLRTEPEPNVYVGSCLVDMYAKCGSLDNARRVFDDLATKNVVTWTAMLAGYAQHGLGEEALALYASMQQEGITAADHVTFVCLLKACASIRALDLGKQLHSQVQDRGLDGDVVVGSCLVDMYAKCGSIADARRVFDNLPSRNVVAWTAMLAGYAQLGLGNEALALYAVMEQERMFPADYVTFLCLLKACASAGALLQGKQLHSQIQARGLESNVLVSNCLVDMYAKCGSLDEARRVFDNMLTKDGVTWTSMLSGYAQHGLGQEVLSLYAVMQKEGINPTDHVAFVCLLKACAIVGALHQGKQLHCQIQTRGLGADLVVNNCLVAMYAKCGSLDDARKVFDSMSTRDVVTWSAMVTGYSQYGLGQEALQCYEAMRLAGIQPDAVTFVSLLTACSHAGLAEKGLEYFDSMSKDFGMTPEIEHYVSMVDLFGRAGNFSKVEQLLSVMPMQPDLATWLCVLGACRKHGNIALAERVFDNALRLQPKDAAAYVLMSHIYADAGLFDRARALFKCRRREGAWKEPGWSWIEVEQEAHTFFVGDRKHPEHEEIHGLLDKVTILLRQTGNISWTHCLPA